MKGRRDTESDFQRSVLDLARVFGWRSAHFRSVCVQRSDGSTRWQTPVQGDGAGLPDLVLVRERVVWVELKSDRGLISNEQKVWLEALRRAGQEVYVWRPKDWNEIVKCLEYAGPNGCC